MEPIVGSTLALGLLVALASWNVHFASPATGIDQGWIAGLYMAAHRGLDFGSQIVFTWGPLAFLRLPFLYYQGLAVLGFVYSALLYAALGVSFVWTLRRGFNAVVAVALSFALLAVLPALNWAPVVAAIWCLAVLAPEPPTAIRRIVVFGAAAFGAAECLVRLSSGPVILLMAAFALLGLSTRWRDLASFVATAVATFVVLWFAAGQGIGNFPEFVHGSIEIVSGYSQAMTLIAAPQWWVPMAIVAWLLLVACAALSGRDKWTRVAAAAVMATVAFATFKEGVVRYEAGHAEILFSTLAALALTVPWRRSTWPLAAATFALVGWLAIQAIAVFPADRVNPLKHVESFATEVETLFGPGMRDELTKAARATMVDEYKLDPASLGLLRGQSVQVDPWEAGVAWAYRLDWDPLPLFQNYAAYTSYLDQRNVDALLGPGGPTRVLRENMAEPDTPYPFLSVDARFPAWDPPAQGMALLCNFTPLRTTRRWQVLARSSDRCGEPRLLSSVDTEYGQTVQVPRVTGDKVVFARIHGAGVSGFERIRTFLFRAKLRFAVVNGGAAYRLVPGTAADGLIMRIPKQDDLPGPAFHLSPDAETVSPQGASGPLKIDFYAMPIRP